MSELGEKLFQLLKQNQDALDLLYHHHPLRMIALFVLAKVAVYAFALPGAFLLSIAAGAVFGFKLGVVLVSFAAAGGSTLTFLAARFFFHDWVARRWGARLRAFQDGFEKNGKLYLFSIRLLPFIPHFAVSFAMALTKIRARNFFWVSLVGMLPGTLVYVNAGRMLRQIERPSDIIRPSILVSFALIALLPWIGRAMVRLIAAKQKV